ncbi:hypothetical protein [Arthrobacter sp. 35W]|uniref:hypothetical protein n=1 Tax=Arthrobacter sp. 35W TaxID=1132441 RepID=UPI00042578E4|nr:hypothetical protein [Arthrobacter sp. 35W]
MINLQQDADGNIRMSRHFPASVDVSITFTDGSQEVFTGQQVNELYDAALAVYREKNHLDAKGFIRHPVKTGHQRNGVGFVPVQAGMAK